MSVMIIKKHARLDYDSILENVVAVYHWKERRIEKGVYKKCLVCVDLHDRKSVCNDNYPWYKGAFGNCLIGLETGFTDKLYLLNEKSYQEIRYQEFVNHITDNELEKLLMKKSTMIIKLETEE